MAEMIVDTNFLITCIKQKIDFFEFAELSGITVLVPEQVITELAKIVVSKQKRHVKNAAALALKIIEISPHEKTILSKRYVDAGIIEKAKANPNLIIATLDQEIQKSVQNHRVMILETNKLEIF